MCRSEPQMPLASTWISASPAAGGPGSGFSSTLTRLGAWKVTARIGANAIAAPLSPAASGGDLGAEAVAAALGPGGLGHPRLQRELLLEVGGLGVLEGDVLAFEQLDEDLDELRVELLAGDAAQLL